MKRTIMGAVLLVSIIFISLTAISNYRSIDKSYACTGYVNKIPKVYSLQYDRFYSGQFWSDWGYAHVKLQSDWYDFAGAYYFDKDGKLDKKIMEKSQSYFFQDGKTIHASINLETSSAKEIIFNLETKVLIYKDRKTNTVFEGVCAG